MKPSVGRIVHYVSYGTPNGEYPSVCRAAIVTEVDEYDSSAPRGDFIEHFIGHVNLCVLNPEGMFFNKGCHQDEVDKKGGTWHWPEKQESQYV